MADIAQNENLTPKPNITAPAGAPETTGIIGADLPKGVSRSAVGISTFEPEAAVPEDQRIKSVEASLKSQLEEYDNMTTDQKAKLDPKIVARLEAFRVNPQVAPEAPVSATTTVSKSINTLEPRISTLPGVETSASGLGTIATEKTPIQTTGQAATNIGINPVTAEATKIGTPAMTVDGKPAIPPGTRTW